MPLFMFTFFLCSGLVDFHYSDNLYDFDLYEDTKT
jgi:hypothetical protein